VRKSSAQSEWICPIGWRELLSDGIGIGLALNILFWLGVVAAFCCVGVFIGKECFPGGSPKRSRKGPHSRQRHRNGNGKETGYKG
jgi:hypothetical protein